MSDLKINIEWMDIDHELPEVKSCGAMLEIRVNDQCATRGNNIFSQSSSDRVCVSAYPLALWLAASWWRLRWEPKPSTINTDWRMAHDMSAAGYGYVWPPVRIFSEGDMIAIRCSKRKQYPYESIEYFSVFSESVPYHNFERQIDDFISLIVARLEMKGHQDTDLQKIWRKLIMERQDKDFANYRRLEAMSGFDPGYAPGEYMENLFSIEDYAGLSPTAEIAAAYADSSSRPSLDELRHCIESSQIIADISGFNDLKKEVQPHKKSQPPQDQGRVIARAARMFWSLDNDTISDQDLANCFGTSPNFQKMDGVNLPFSLVERDDKHLRLAFRRSGSTTRRFESARLIGAFLTSSRKDRWLPITDAKTAHQRFQRAFATEFLCPIDRLMHFLNGDYSESSQDNAAQYFNVSPRMINHNLRNNGIEIDDLYD